MMSPTQKISPWPILTVGLPLLMVVIVTFLLYAASFISNAGWEQLKPSPLPINELFVLTARDIGGRIQFGTASVLLYIMSGASIILAYTVAANRFGRRLAVFGRRLAVYLTSGIVIAAVISVILAYFEPGISLIRRSLNQVLTPNLFQMADQTIRWNLVASFIAGLGLLSAFAAVAMPANESERTGRALRQRMRALEQTTVCCAIVLVILTAVNKALVDWPQAFLIKDHREAYAYLAGAISTFWGTLGTIVLVSALLPTFVSLRRDIEKAANPDETQDETATARWKQDNKLEFDFKSGIGAAVAAAAPMLTAPGIDLASKLLH
jgi:hypothetical protein